MGINKLKITNWRDQKTEQTGRSPSRRRRSAIACGATEKEEDITYIKF